MESSSPGVLYHSRQTLEQNPGKKEFREIYHTDFKVISEIQLAKLGAFVIYILGGKIWGSDMNFRGKFWGQAPSPPPNIEVPPG